MTINEIDNLCKYKEHELPNKYFGKLVKEAAIERSESFGKYTKELPLKIEEEFFQYLKDLCEQQNNPDKLLPTPPESILDKRHICKLITENARGSLQDAYEDATRRTLWERVAKTPHNDLIFYKGLLEEYTKRITLVPSL